MAEFLRINHGDCSLIERHRFRNGDILLSRPDGWPWSRSELPNVVKVPFMDIKVAKQYEPRMNEITWKIYAISKDGKISLS